MNETSGNSRQDKAFENTNQISQVAPPQEFDDLRFSLNRGLEDLCNKYGWNYHGSPRTQAALAILSHSCERRIDYLFRNQSKAVQTSKFDRYYSEKSNYSTILLVDRIKEKLAEAGFAVNIVTEQRTPFGTFDISILSGSPCRVFQNGHELMKIEVKGSIGLTLEQLTRYLLDSSPLILVRVLTNQVCLIRANEFQDYLSFVMVSMTKKIDRLLAKKTWTIPGRYCNDCPDSECPNYPTVHPEAVQEFSLVSMPSDQFEWDIKTFFRNLHSVADRTAKLVVNEVSRLNSTVEKQVLPAKQHESQTHYGGA